MIGKLSSMGRPGSGLRSANPRIRPVACRHILEFTAVRSTAPTSPTRTQSLAGVAMELHRTSDPAEARRLLAEHGACVLEGLRPESTATAECSAAIWGDELVSAPPVAEVSMAAEVALERTGVPTWAPGISRVPTNPSYVGVYDGTAGRSPPRAFDELLEPHSDGFAYGDAYPDAIVLLCSQSCEYGGETFLVDGYRVLESLDLDVVEQLATRPVNQGEAEVSALPTTPLVGCQID